MGLCYILYSQISMSVLTILVRTMEAALTLSMATCAPVYRNFKVYIVKQVSEMDRTAFAGYAK